MIDPAETLGAAAQVAVTLAGFAGVAVVFGSRAVHEWSRVDKFRLRLLLTFSALPLAFSLTGLLLLATPLPILAVWSWCSVVALAFFLSATVVLFKGFAQFSTTELEAAGSSRLVFYPGALLGLVITALQFVNIAALHAFWPFFSAIVVAMLASTLQFVRLILNRREWS